MAVTGTLLAFVAVNDAILPVPPPARPIDGVLFVQVYTVPVTAPAKFTAAVDVLLHTTWLAGWATSGVGFTVIVNEVDVPVQVTPALV